MQTIYPTKYFAVYFPYLLPFPDNAPSLYSYIYIYVCISSARNISIKRCLQNILTMIGRQVSRTIVDSMVEDDVVQQTPLLPAKIF